MIYPATLPALCDHIAHVVRTTSCEKVQRVYARRVVAFVKYVHAFWNWLVVGDFPRVAVNADQFLVDLDRSIPVLGYTANPGPAVCLFSDVYARPETLARSAAQPSVSSSKRVAVPNPSLVVAYTPSASAGGRVTTIDGTSRLSSSCHAHPPRSSYHKER